MLMLIYILLTSYFTVMTLIVSFLDSLNWVYETYFDPTTAITFNWMKQSEELRRHGFIILCFLMISCVSALITAFLKFHIMLASKNLTTIENLEREATETKNQGKRIAPNQFDIGIYNNWYSIFGTNIMFWPFPIQMGSGKPLGDGIYWPTRDEHVQRAGHADAKATRKTSIGSDKLNETSGSGSTTHSASQKKPAEP
jgi:hypothetical protein